MREHDNQGENSTFSGAEQAQELITSIPSFGASEQAESGPQYVTPEQAREALTPADFKVGWRVRIERNGGKGAESDWTVGRMPEDGREDFVYAYKPGTHPETGQAAMLERGMSPARLAAMQPRVEAGSRVTVADSDGNDHEWVVMSQAPSGEVMLIENIDDLEAGRAPVRRMSAVEVAERLK